MSELEELKLAYAECSRQRNELLNKLKSQAQQRPVAWLVEFENGDQELHFEEQSVGETHTPLCKCQPAQRKPLTNEQIDAVLDSPAAVNFLVSNGRERLRLFARAIEAAHNIKENT